MNYLKDKERDEFIAILKWYAKKANSNKRFAKKLFVSAGIITKKGNLRKPYKHLCIALGQV